MQKINIIFCFLSIFLLASCSEENSGSSKIERADSSVHISNEIDCINEPACVWEALAPLLSDKNNNNTFAPKWKEDISIKIIGEETKNISSAIQIITPYYKDIFPYNINVESPYNFLIVYSDNMSKDLEKRYRERFQKILGSDLVFERYQQLTKTNQEQCFSLKLEDQGEIKAYFMFIEKKEGENYCFLRFFYSGLVRGEALENFVFSGLYNDSQNKAILSTFDLFLLYVCYQLEYNENDTLQEIEVRYVEQYSKFIRDFKKLKNNNKAGNNGAF